MSDDLQAQRRITRSLTPARTVPPFGNDADEAEWYSTHDTYHVPTYPVIDPEDSGISPGFGFVAVRLFRKEIEELERRARALEIDVTTYVRLIINRHLFDEPAMATSAMLMAQSDDASATEPVDPLPRQSREIYDMLARFVLKNQPPEPRDTADEPADEAIAARAPVRSSANNGDSAVDAD